MNSIENPWALGSEQFKFGVNVTVRGGIAQTRPGHKLHLSLPKGNFQGGIIFAANKQASAASQVTSTSGVVTTTEATVYNPQGLGVATPELLYSVFFVDGQGYYSPWPFVQPQNWDVYKLTAMKLDPNVKTVAITVATKQATVDSVGNITVTPSHQVVIAQDGVNPAVTWDGSDTTGQESDTIPVGQWMAFSGSRLWVASHNLVLASDLADPFSWKERVSGGTSGDFIFPRPVVTMLDYTGQNNDSILIVWTDRGTYKLSSGILDRTQWGTTPNFQATLIPTVGCVAPRSVAFQAGVLWWYSQGGLINLDVAKSAYLSSAVVYRDAEMARVKQYMPDNVSGICAASYENYLLYSVPYLESKNSQTMVLDYATAAEWGSQGTPAWCGVWNGTRPVAWATLAASSIPRLFHFSVDYAPTSDGSYNHLWESFRPERYDTFYEFNSDGTQTTRISRIYSQIETQLLGDSFDLKTFVYARIDATQIGGVTNLRVSFRGSRGAYTKTLDTVIQAVTHQFQYVNSPQAATIAAMEPLHTQYRRIITETASREAKSGCEDCNINLVDKAYSLLLEWTGELGIEGATIYMDPFQESHVGRITSPETQAQACVVGDTGASMTVPTTPSPYYAN